MTVRSDGMKNVDMVDVCPHCGRSTITYRTMTNDGEWMGIRHCKDCGDVVQPCEPKEPITDWSAS